MMLKSLIIKIIVALGHGLGVALGHGLGVALGHGPGVGHLFGIPRVSLTLGLTSLRASSQMSMTDNR